MNDPRPSSTQAPDPGRRRHLLTLFLGAWAVVLVVLVATLMVGHLFTLPLPDRDSEVLHDGLAATRMPEHAGKWQATHVLYAKCGCSQRIVDHLLTSERPEGLAEQLIVIGEQAEWAQGAKAIGLPYTTVTQAELKEKYDIEAAPLMVVTDPGSEVRYAGGYTDRKRGLAIRDLEIINTLRKGESAETVPLYGCAVSKTLQDALDPLGMKY